MNVVIAGSRTITDIRRILDLVEGTGFVITGVISGCARGVDSAALMKPWACPVHKMPADWSRFGLKAGYRRNAEMEQVGDALIAIWDGESNGTRHMIRLMETAGKPLVVFREERPEVLS